MRLNKIVVLSVFPSVFLTIFNLSTHAQELVTVNDRTNSAKTLIDILDKNKAIDPNEAHEAFNAWSTLAEQAEAAWIKLKKIINSGAQKADIMSTVPIQSVPKPGANIQYLTSDEQMFGVHPKTVAGLTNTEAKLLIGYYYFWTVRNGTSTSRTDREYYILKDGIPVELLEEK